MGAGECVDPRWQTASSHLFIDFWALFSDHHSRPGPVDFKGPVSAYWPAPPIPASWMIRMARVKNVVVQILASIICCCPLTAPPSSRRYLPLAVSWSIPVLYSIRMTCWVEGFDGLAMVGFGQLAIVTHTWSLRPSTIGLCTLVATMNSNRPKDV